MNKDYKPINNLWKDSEGYRYFGTLKLSSKIKYDGDDFIPLWEWINQLQQENKILKENAENNDKVVDKVNWGNMLLKKENKQLNGAIQTYDILLKSNIEENNQLKAQIEEYQKALDETISEKIDIQNNWNGLKDYIAKEYYMYLPLEASTKSIIILIDKMQELEGSDCNENN